jgi:hypothetical protein
MDTQTPDHAANAAAADPEAPSSCGCVRRPHRALAAMMASVPADTREAAQELFDSFHPRDPADAQLAAIAVAAAQAALDGFARAARADSCDETATRLRSNALAAGHAYAGWAQPLRERLSVPTAAPAPARKAPPAEPARDVPEVPPVFIALQPGATPIPAVETFQPRDRFGKPIPDLRTDLMTRAQVLASLTIPRDPKLEAEALAEEAAMIAEQAALEAAGRAGSG